MDKITISYRPHFHLRMTEEETGTLMTLAARHYSPECKAAGREGGFIYGWHNSARFGSGQATASFRELDIASKVCELAGFAGCTDQEVLIADEFCRRVREAIQEANSTKG